MCTRADSITADLEPAGKHGVLHASASAHDDKTAHDAAHDTTAHDTTTAATSTATAATTPVRRHYNSDSTIHG